jgi:hypothetical protein
MRFPVAVTFSLMGFGLFFGGCSEQGIASQPPDAPVKITISQMFVTVKNDAGMPLTDVTISIVPLGRPPFTYHLDRFEGGESRDVMLGDFNSRDGARFVLRVVNPKTVEVKGTDVAGKIYDVKVPWK